MTSEHRRQRPRSTRHSEGLPGGGSFWAMLALTALGTACGSDTASATQALPDNTAEALATYAEIVYASYQDSLEAARDLDAACEALVADPSTTSHASAQQAWLAAREPYLQTEVYRFYDGPIDDPDTGPEGMINAWPLDEAYIDYVAGDPEAGIINDPQLELSADALMRLNEQGGEENIATGFHAVEFLLWGQDGNPDGPGQRSYTDYLRDDSATADHAGRRGEYLTLVSNLLDEHLESLVDAWDTTDTSSFASHFLAGDEMAGLASIMTGMIVLTGFETGGERLQTALDSGDEEDEHSCFSDNTHRDMIQDIQGIANVWHGKYRRLDGSTLSGVGVASVLHEVKPELADEIDGRIEESQRLADALHVPFDQEIRSDNSEGRERVRALVIALGDLEESFQQGFRALGLDVPGAQ